MRFSLSSLSWLPNRCSVVGSSTVSKPVLTLS
jgi:hypothetical protein